MKPTYGVVTGCDVGVAGIILDRNGRGYVSRAAARAAADRRGLCPVETFIVGETLPPGGDAAGWDEYRRAHGRSGEHH